MEAKSRSSYTQMAAPTLRILTDDQIREIHSAACEILERTGMEIRNKKARELLHGYGAKIGPEKDRVRIPGWLVNDSIRKAPERVTLCNRDGKRHIFLEDHNVHYGCNPDNPEYTDPYTHERRPFTSKDGADLAKIIDWSDHIDFVLNACFSADVHPDVADRVIIRQMILNQRKSIGFSCKDADTLKDIIEMAAIIAGGHEELQMNPYMFHIQEPISPLLHEGNSVDEIMICAENRFPLVYYPMPMAGATAPATAAGELAQAHAESMTGLVIHQLTNPGAPFITGGVNSIMDMKTTRFCYGAPELCLRVAAHADLAHYFHLPFWGTAGCVETPTVDEQASVELAMTILMAGLSGANLIHDTGLMDQATVTCPEILVMADEIMGYVKNILNGINVSKETLCLDDIDKLGPAGNHLGTEHTFTEFKNFWMPSLFSRASDRPDNFPSFQKRLNEKARNIIETHEVPPLDDDKLKVLLELEKKWMSEYE